LGETREILGAPEVELELSADKPQAQICVRLNDVAPDGSSLRVSFGLLNLTHRESHENPEALEPGKRYRVKVKLNDAAHAFPKGHRIRIAVSSSYWPIAWPSPATATVTLFTGGSRMTLPVRDPRAEDAKLAPFGVPEATPPLKTTVLRPGKAGDRIERDLVTGEQVFITEENDDVRIIEHIVMQVEHRKLERFTIREDDPLSALAETQHVHIAGRGDWEVKTVTKTRLSATATEFLLHASLDAYEGDRRVLSRNWDVRRPRDEV